MGHFGTAVNPSHYLESPAPGGGDPTKQAVAMVRPPAGSTVLVRDAVTGAALAPITSQAYGYFSANYPGTDLILLSSDGGTTWIGPLQSAESTTTSATGGGGGGGGGTALKFIPQNGDGSFPDRRNYSTDRTKPLVWVVTNLAIPPIATDPVSSTNSPLPVTYDPSTGIGDLFLT